MARDITKRGYYFRGETVKPEEIFVVYVEGTYSVYREGSTTHCVMHEALNKLHS